MKRNRWIAALLAMSLAVSASTGSITALGANGAPQGSTALVNPKVNSRINPLGIDDTDPVFSWQLDSNIIGQSQASYQIKVYKEAPDGELVWDSGVQTSTASTQIEYGSTGEAQPLEACTRYYWTIDVTDATGESLTYQDASYFETGLMDSTLSAWDGAQWIGANDYYVNAQELPVYNIDYTLKLVPESTKVSFLFGADDQRLLDATKNNYLIEGENYIAYELDASSLPAKINIWRAGYCPEDIEAGRTLVSTLEVPETVINQDNLYAPHAFHLVNSGNAVALTLDGTAIGKAVTLNPLNKTVDVPTYPLLGDIGFEAEAGQVAMVTDLSVSNYRTPNGVLFGENTGATYSIFQGQRGLSVADGTIYVNGGVSGIRSYSDPSYGSMPMLRTELQADKEIEDARLYITARGVYEMYINGERMSDDWFNPGNNQFQDSMPYSTYDVTDMLQTGENAIGVMLGSGWWSDQMSFTIGNYNFFGDKPGLLAKLVVEYTDGDTEEIVTNTEDWKYYDDSPVVYAGFFDGEVYDATKEAAIENWATADYDDSGWETPDVIKAASEGFETPALVGKSDEPARVVQTIDAKFHSEPKDGIFVYDMGTNMVGVPQITIPASVPAGTKLTIRYAESIYPDLPEDNPYNYGDLAGMILTENYRAAMSTDTYIKGSDQEETFVPSFTFHGYQYIEISGVEEAIPEEDIKGLVISSLSSQASHYESSNSLTNQLFDNIMRSTYGNHLSIPTDCNQRNERMGWTGDANVFSRTATFMSDLDQFYSNWMRIMRDSQSHVRDGQYPNTSPAYVADNSQTGSFSISWSAAGIVVPWQCYQQYNDTSLIEEHFDSMKSCVDSMGKNVADGHSYILKTGGLAEHLSLESTDSVYCSNIVYIYLLDIFSQMADAIGRTDVAAQYRELYNNTKAEWNDVFVNPETKEARTLSGTPINTQAAYDLAIAHGVIADESRDAYAQHLVEACERGYQGEPYTITTGFIGTAPLLPALTETGKIDAAYKMFEQTNYASWLYPVTQGATSIWERWNSYTDDNGYAGNNGMNSFNHYALGAVGAWMINYQIGIQTDADAPGFQHFILQPTPGGAFTYVNGSYDSYYGTIVSNWTADGSGNLTSYTAEVPANTSATLYLPVSADAVKDFEGVDGVTFLGVTEHNGMQAAAFELTSGGFAFAVKDGKLTVSTADGYVSVAQADKTILNKVIAYAQAQKESAEFENVIPMVQESFTAALDEAKAVSESLFAGQAAVDKAWQDLMLEIHKLGFVKGDKTSLFTLITVGNSYNLDNYVEAGKAEFTAALSAAQTVYDDPNAMQIEVDGAMESLLNAMVNLRLKADKSLLTAAVAETAVADLSLYTPESVELYNQARANADAVLADETLTVDDQAAVSAAADGLRAAYSGLTLLEAGGAAPVAGDTALTTGTGNAKTGESAPIAVAVALLALAGAAVIGRKRR